MFVALDMRPRAIAFSAVAFATFPRAMARYPVAFVCVPSAKDAVFDAVEPEPRAADVSPVAALL